MKTKKLLPLLLFLTAIPFLGRLVVWILQPDYIHPHRCDGDLIVSEIRGHRVEMIRWLR